MQSNSKKVDEELKKWEEEIKKKESARRNRKEAAKQSGPEDIAWTFRALGVDMGADFETCRKAYRKLAQQYHPDKWHNSEKREKAEKLFKLIGEAFSRIKEFYGK